MKETSFGNEMMKNLFFEFQPMPWKSEKYRISIKTNYLQNFFMEKQIKINFLV